MLQNVKSFGRHATKCSHVKSFGRHATKCSHVKSFCRHASHSVFTHWFFCTVFTECLVKNVLFTGWTTYVIHPGILFSEKLYNDRNFSTWQNKTHFYTILTTNLYDKSQTKVLYGLVWYYLSFRQHFLLMLDPGWTTYVIHPGIVYAGYSIKRKYCRND